ncbi:MAG TPA: NRAMP family divalent metal transporter [Acidimicrobiales bacterium]|nr:NRAMP family divalent metal transporter [Acidimicrobiales bacterium]
MSDGLGKGNKPSTRDTQGLDPAAGGDDQDGHLTWRAFVRSLGPGLVAGASDVDPTTVATIAVIGATTMFKLAWLVILILPMLAVVQVVSARTGAATGQDLQQLVVRRYGRGPQILLLVSIVSVTVITLAADLEAGAAAVGLLVHADWKWFVVPVAVAVGALLVWGTYDEVQRVLRYVILVLLAYFAAAVLAHPHWSAVARGTLIPNFRWDTDYVQGALALVGTTLTSYVYVWQTVEVAEEKPPASRLRLKEVDAASGILFAVALFWFILVATGATLGRHHTQVQTAQDAAKALTPVAGRFAGDLFGIGLLSSALIALPVLLGTISYVIGAEFGWRSGLSERVRDAPGFYIVLLVSLAAAAGVAVLGVSPIHLLVIASVAGGLGTPIGLVFLMLVASDGDVMGRHTVTGRMKAAGWAVAAFIGIMSVVYLVQQFA